MNATADYSEQQVTGCIYAEDNNNAETRQPCQWIGKALHGRWLQLIEIDTQLTEKYCSQPSEKVKSNIYRQHNDS